MAVVLAVVVGMFVLVVVKTSVLIAVKLVVLLCVVILVILAALLLVAVVMEAVRVVLGHVAVCAIELVPIIVTVLAVLDALHQMLVIKNIARINKREDHLFSQ